MNWKDTIKDTIRHWLGYEIISPVNQLHCAVRGNNLRLVRHALSRGINSLDILDALVTAAWHGRAEIAEFLIQQDVDINHNTTPYSNPLITAATHKHIKVVELLIKYGANINARDYDGKTPLMRALGNNGVDTASVLINQ